MSSGLTLSLFGRFQLQRDDRPLTDFESDKARALLAYLALSPGRPQRRELLCALLWPDLSQSDARHNLSQVLSSLRSLLGDRDAATPFLLANRQSVQVNPDAVFEVDTLAFARLLEQSRSHQHARPRQCPDCAGRLREAMALYQGDFLPGLSVAAAAEFDEWLTVQRERWHHQALDAAGRLADYHEARGELTEAEAYARRQIALEPWREEAHRQLMRLLAHGGQRSVALAQYELCRQALAETFGVEPAAETTRLYRRLRQADRSRLVRLPEHTFPLVGRRQELAELSALLAGPERRLLTIVGPGGSGKTRLALALARRVEARFLNGVAVIFLSGVDDAAQIASAIVTALELPYGQDDPLARAQDYLREKEMLLILDNCEHLPQAGEVAGKLLAAAAELKIVATSRHPLHQTLETRYPLGGLPLAAGDEADALHFFEQAARRVRPDFVLEEGNLDDALEICRLVDGLPLALEMAGAWVRAMSCAAIATEIERSRDFLVSEATDVTARHRSMRAVWNHSWDLLTATERKTLTRLTVFRGGFSRDALVSVTGASLANVAALLDKSLLQRSRAGRYAMHQLVRQYAAARWQSAGAAARTADGHCDYYLSLVADQEEALWQAEASAACQKLRPELENIRQAWAHAARTGRWPILTATAGALAAFYRLEGLVAEGENAFTLAAGEVMGSAGNGDTRLLVACLQTHRARFLLSLGRSEEAAAVAQQARLAAEQTGDRAAIAAAGMVTGHLLAFRGEHDAAQQAYKQALYHFRSLEDERGRARALGGLGSIHWRHSDFQAAIARFHAALALDRKLQNQRGVIRHLSDLSIVYREQGEFARALNCLEEAVTLAEALGHLEHIARTANNLGLVYWQMGRRQQALAAFKRAVTIAEELGLRRGIVVTVSNIGIIERERGRYTEALGHYRRAISMAREIGLNNALAVTLGNVANVYRDMGSFEQAWGYYEEALALDEALGNREGVGRHWGEIGRWYAMQGNDTAAQDYLERAVERLREVGSRYYLSSLLPELAGVLLRQDAVGAAAALVSEGEELAAALRRREAQARVAVVAAHIAQRRGDEAAARAILHEALENAGQPELEAALLYALWEVTGESAHGRRAWDLYHELALTTPNVTYRERRDALRAAVQ